MEEDIKLLNHAFEEYQIDQRENLPNQILDYIEHRLFANKDLISELIETLQLNLTFEEIWNVFQKEKNNEISYKKTESFQLLDDNFYVGMYHAPKGNIVIETDDVLETLKCFVHAIQTRNSITISQLDYEELSLSSFLLVIFCEALNKFHLDRNLMMILPYEECLYDNYDAVMKEENDQKVIEEKPDHNVYVIYQENDEFENEIEEEQRKLKENGIFFEVLRGEFHEVIDKINSIKPIGACIYTNEGEKGYQFINFVRSKNVFVNATLLNANNREENEQPYYIKKKIIYPMLWNHEKQQQEKITEKTEENITNNDISLEEIAIAIPETNIWYKRIFEAIKRFFSKKD